MSSDHSFAPSKIFSLAVLIFFLLSKNGSSQTLLYLDGSGAMANLTIQNGAQVYIQGGYQANSNASGMEADGELHLTDGNTSINSHWTDNMGIGGSILSSSTGTVFFESAFQQNINGVNTKFYN